MIPQALRRPLGAGLQAMGIEPEPRLIDGLLAYLALLQQWNRVFNLTAIRDPRRSLAWHLLDSLSLLALLPSGRVADLGSGAGLPGVPLALARRGQEFTLIDSSAKKFRFLTQAVTTLGLENVIVVRSRVEDYAPGAAFDAVVSRAFASLTEFARCGLPLCRAEGGVLLAMKGRYPAAELAELPTGLRVAEVRRVQVPELQAERHIVTMIPTSEH